MSELLFPTYDLDESDVKSILDIYNKIKTTHSALFDLDFTLNFKIFNSFSYNNIEKVGPIISLNNNKQYLACVKTSYTLASASRSINLTFLEYQFWGVVFLKNNYGHILIKPETFLDKIHNLISHVELKFEDDKEFSKKFYVITNDNLKATSLINLTFRNYIQQIQETEFIIEILENKLIIGNKKIIELQPALHFIEFMDNISRVF